MADVCWAVHTTELKPGVLGEVANTSNLDQSLCSCCCYMPSWEEVDFFLLAAWLLEMLEAGGSMDH